MSAAQLELVPPSPSDDPQEILTTPANVSTYVAKGYRVTEIHVPGEFGEQLVRMVKDQTEEDPQ